MDLVAVGRCGCVCVTACVPTPGAVDGLVIGREDGNRSAQLREQVLYTDAIFQEVQFLVSFVSLVMFNRSETFPGIIQ